MSSELSHFVHSNIVANCVGDCRLSKRVDSDSPAIQSVGGNPGKTTVVLHQSPWGLAVHPAFFECYAIRSKWPKERPLSIIGNASSMSIGLQRLRGIEQNLACPLVPLLGHMEVVLRRNCLRDRAKQSKGLSAVRRSYRKLMLKNRMRFERLFT